MTLPVPSFAALAAGNQNLSLFDSQFAAVAALGAIPCTATGANTVVLTLGASTPLVSAYVDLAPAFVFKQAQNNSGATTIAVGSLSPLTAYKSNGSTPIGSGDLVAGNLYVCRPLSSLNGGNGGFVVDVVGTAAASAGLIVSANFYAGSQTITIPATVTKAFCRMWGGSGGSGGSDNSTFPASGGTGAAGYLEKLLTGMTAGNTLAWTQGAAGAAGTNAPGNGGNGGASSLASGSQIITTLTANGSNGSLAAASNAFTAGTVGGTATNGDVNITGARGMDGNNGGSAGGGAPGGSLYAPGAAGVAGRTVATAGNAGAAGGLYVIWYT